MATLHRHQLKVVYILLLCLVILWHLYLDYKCRTEVNLAARSRFVEYSHISVSLPDRSSLDSTKRPQNKGSDVIDENLILNQSSLPDGNSLYDRKRIQHKGSDVIAVNFLINKSLPGVNSSFNRQGMHNEEKESDVIFDNLILNNSHPDENSLYNGKRIRNEGSDVTNLEGGERLGREETRNSSNTEIAVDELIRFLTKDLTHKLEKVIPRANPKIPITCREAISREKSCSKSGCLRLSLPRSLRSRIEQLVSPPRLRYNDTYKKVFEDMGDSVPGYYDIILVTGASSNHYLESKALLSSLHKFIFPYLKNFTLIYYDLGLTKAQREDISQFCRCHVKRFPFSRFPRFCSLLNCFAWKPLLLNAHASRANLVHWMDASIRFSDHHNGSKLLDNLYKKAREYGAQAGCLGGPIPWVTLPTMPHFFGDELCAYHPYRDITAGFTIFHNEALIRQAVLTPWSACALDENCMCPYREVNIGVVKACPRQWSKYDYGACHRFDQSALNIILRKLFQEKSLHILRHDIYRYIDIRRGDTVLVT